MKKEYKGFVFECEDLESELALVEYINSLGESPVEIPDASSENYDNWCADFDFRGVKYLELPKTIKRIGKCAFAQSRIEELVADGVEDIDELAFYNTRALKRVSARACKRLLSTDPETGEYTEGSDAFNHSAVSDLIFPSVTDVGRYAFYDMPNIQRLDLPSAVHIERHAIYGNENLVSVDIGALTNAGFATISMCPRLGAIHARALRSADKMAFFDGVDEYELTAPCDVTLTQPEAAEPLDYSEKAMSEARRKERFYYDITYRGFKFNLVHGLSRAEKAAAKEQLVNFVDGCYVAGSGALGGLAGKLWGEHDGEAFIPCSENLNSNESGIAALGCVRDIFVPEDVRAIGDYAFAKCYGLESIVAPGVEVVGDHAFYCDGALRYMQFDACDIVASDAFNGASFDFADVEAHPISKGMAKIFLPGARRVGKHAFWQTGLRLISLPCVEAIAPTAIEENEALQRVELKTIKSPRALTVNPQLREVLVGGKDAKMAFHGSPLLGVARELGDE